MLMKAQWISLVINCAFLYFLHDAALILSRLRKFDPREFLNKVLSVELEKVEAETGSRPIEFNKICEGISWLEYSLIMWKTRLMYLRTNSPMVYIALVLVGYLATQVLLAFTSEFALVYVLAYGLVLAPGIVHYRLFERLSIKYQRPDQPEVKAKNVQSTVVEFVSTWQDRLVALYDSYQKHLDLPDEFVTAKAAPGPGSRPVSTASEDTLKDLLPSPYATASPNYFNWLTLFVPGAVSGETKQKTARKPDEDFEFIDENAACDKKND
jgi:hypothetical protein